MLQAVHIATPSAKAGVMTEGSVSTHAQGTAPLMGAALAMVAYMGWEAAMHALIAKTVTIAITANAAQMMVAMAVGAVEVARLHVSLKTAADSEMRYGSMRPAPGVLAGFTESRIVAT